MGCGASNAAKVSSTVPPSTDSQPSEDPAGRPDGARAGQVDFEERERIAREQWLRLITEDLQMETSLMDSIYLTASTTSSMTDLLNGLSDPLEISETDRSSILHWRLCKFLSEHEDLEFNINRLEGLSLSTIVDLYKDIESTRLQHNLKVIFQSEIGEDYGALSREFFCMAFDVFFNKDMSVELDGPLFEGTSERLLPRASLCHLDNGLYELFGKLLAHSALQVEMGVCGLSPALVHVLSHKVQLDDLEDVLRVPIEISEVPGPQLQKLLIKMERAEKLLPKEQLQLRKYMAESGLSMMKIVPQNYIHIQQNLLAYFVLLKRKKQIQDIRKGMNALELHVFLCHCPTKNNLDIVFPSLQDNTLTPELLFNTIKNLSSVDEKSVEYFKKYVDDRYKEKQGSEGLRDLLQFWTGCSVIQGPLLLSTHPDSTFPTTHTCFSDLCLPGNVSDYVQFKTNFDIALEHGKYGFGFI